MFSRLPLHFLLEFNLLLLPFIKLHNLKALLLDQTTLFNIEFFLGLSVNFFDFFISFLLDEAHHLFDLLIDSREISDIR